MEEIRARMSAIEDLQHQSYVEYRLADILIIIMCAALCGLDKLGELVIYTKSKGDFLLKGLGIEGIPSRATFARILSMIDGKQIVEAIIDVLHNRFGTAGEVAAVDGKAICSTTKPGNPHSALQILSAYVTSSGIILSQESIHEKTNEIPVFKPAAGSYSTRAIIYLCSKRISPPCWRMSVCFLRIRATPKQGKEARRWRKTRDESRNEFAAKSKIFPG